MVSRVTAVDRALRVLFSSSSPFSRLLTASISLDYVGGIHHMTTVLCGGYTSQTHDNSTMWGGYITHTHDNSTMWGGIHHTHDNSTPQGIVNVINADKIET